MSKTGRNEPCPCGSGKKYKKCCLDAQQSDELAYRRLSQTYDDLMENLLRFSVEELGQTCLDEAMEDFFEESEWEPDDELLDHFASMFWSWFFFNWSIFEDDSEEGLYSCRLPAETALAEVYIRKNKTALDDLQLKCCSAALHTPFSFQEVLDVQPGRGLVIRDILTGREDEVTDYQASQDLNQGDILFSKLVRILGYSLIIGVSPIKIPQGLKPAIIQLRSELRDMLHKVDEEELHELAPMVRGFYFDIYSRLMHDPKLQNTDGEALSFRTVYYEIDSPKVAFEALHPLCCGQSRQEILESAELDDLGAIHRVEIDWSQEIDGVSPNQETTVHGRIVIEGKELTAEVNSEPREEQLRGEIEHRLNDGARYKTTVITSPEAMMREMDESDRGRDGPEGEDVMGSPEVQELLAEKLKAHWRAWMDMEVPALGGQTPRRAVTSADGRECVEALLQDAEQTSPGKGLLEAQQEAVREVRQELGLDS